MAFEIFLDDVSRMHLQTRAPLPVPDAKRGELAQEAWFDNLIIASEQKNPLQA